MVFWWHFIGILCFRGNNPIRYHGTKLGLLNKLACVGSVSARVRQENWDKSEKNDWRGRGREKMETLFPPLLFSPLPPPSMQLSFFAPALTLATQAREREDCSSLLLTQYTLFCLCNPTWPARDSKLHPIKITQFFWTSTGYGKVKKTRQFLNPKKNTKGMRYRIRRYRYRKECATTFMSSCCSCHNISAVAEGCGRDCNLCSTSSYWTATSSF